MRSSDCVTETQRVPGQRPGDAVGSISATQSDGSLRRKRVKGEVDGSSRIYLLTQTRLSRHEAATSRRFDELQRDRLDGYRFTSNPAAASMNTRALWDRRSRDQLPCAETAIASLLLTTPRVKVADRS